MGVARCLANMPSQAGKTILVTGANSGIGLQTAKHLAGLGANVIMACRSRERAQSAINYICHAVPKAKLEFVQYDQASFKAIESFAEELRDRHLDGLVLNAGICGSVAQRKTVDGYPLIMGTNFYGPVHLVELWREKLLHEHTRVVFVSSLAGRLSRPEPLCQFCEGSANRQYGYSKLCLSIYACRCMRRYGLEAVLVHPGVSGTGILFGQDSALPKCLVSAGTRLLNCFPDKGAKSGLMSVWGICVPYRSNLYIRPRLPLGLFGLPGMVTMPKRYENDGMIDM